jgi:hypothetical protein
LALSNVTGRAIHATVRLTDETDAQLADYEVTVSPHGTKMLTLDGLKASADDAGGVYVAHDGPEGGLDINGGLQDPTSGFSVHLPIRAQLQPSSPSQPPSPQAVSLSELFLMTGAADPMMNFPSGTVFTPYSLVRNISDQPAEITPEVWWMADGSPQSAMLPQVTVAPHQTLNLNVPSLLAAAGLKSFSGYVNLILDTKMQAGGLVFSSGSVDQKNTYVFEVVAHGIAEGMAKEICYWSTGNGDDTMVTLWNAADEPQDLSFTLFFSGGQYVYPIHLGPRETRALNVSQIVHSSIPDAEGNLIPAGVSEGSAEVAGTLGENQHVLISLDVAVYNVGKATCGPVCWECDGVVSAAISPSPFAVAVSGTTAAGFYGTLNTGYQWYPRQASWGSSARSIATVNSCGVVSGVRAGSFTLYASDPYTETEGVGWFCTQFEYFCPTSYFSASAPGQARPAISGPNTVWWFNGQNPNSSSWPTQVTLSTSAAGTWTVNSGSSYVHLSSTSGSSITVTGTGTFSQGANDVSLTVTVNGMTSNPFTMTSKGPKQLSNPNSQSYACTGAGETGWHYDKTYRVLDNFNTIMKGLPVSEGIGAPASDRGDHSTFPAVTPTGGTTDASTGNYTDGIFVCAVGSVNPMPQNYTGSPGTSLVDHISQTWCAGSSASSSSCTGARVQNDTIRRYLDHGEVTIP